MITQDTGVLSDIEIEDMVEDVIHDSRTPQEAIANLRKVFFPAPSHISVFENGVRHLRVLLQPYPGAAHYTFIFRHR
ncbi:hypothetical protein EXS57_01160 [Candidatus Kaiserbacteria bacterium]|nr:hypothetical protein [Candidatus Kaiserbacteria bacterium]